MKALLISLCLTGATCVLLPLTGCQTDTPGATNTLGYYSTMVNDTPDHVTIAAKKAATDLKLIDIVGDYTKIDGHVTCKNSQGDAISIEVAQAGENVSKVTVHVGATGDDAVSKQLVDRIKAHL